MPHLQVGAHLLQTQDIFIISTLIVGGALLLLRSKNAKKTAVDAKAKSVASAKPAAYSASKTLDGIFTVDKKDIVIVYGSQTGTAEEYAGRLVKEGAKYGFQCMAIDPDDYEMQDLCKVPDGKLVIFVVATYGEGEPTDNAVTFNDYLKEQVQDSGDGKPLANLKYAAFGLGNRTYEKFNAAVQFVDKSLSHLGGTRIGERGEGDDAENLEEDFIGWRTQMWKAVGEFFKVDLEHAATKALASGITEHAFKLTEFTDPPPGFIYTGELTDPKITTYDMKNPFYAKLITSRELFSKDEPDARNCLHMEFELAGSKVTYQPGDHLAIMPTNDAAELDTLIRAIRLEHKLDTIITMTATDPASRKKHPFPCPTTYRAVLTNYLDIHVPPKSHIFSTWLPYCSDPETKAYYEKLGSDKQFYTEQVTEHFKSVGELLTDHPVPDLPLDILFDGFQRIQPRSYSISSAARYLDSPTVVHITVSILRFKVGSKLVKGTATNFLYQQHLKHINQEPVPNVPVMVRQSNFKLPRQMSVPILMIGPGTGVAPLRGFVQERCAAVKRGTSLPGPSYLFFGCRNEQFDYIYADEWPKYVQEGGLTAIQTAFSRDTDHKVYVQHKMAESQDLVYDLVFKQNAVIYVCGDGKYMVKDVQKFFIQLVCDKKSMDTEQAIAYLKKEIRDKGRYQEDVWS